MANLTALVPELNSMHSNQAPEQAGDRSGMEKSINRTTVRLPYKNTDDGPRGP